MKRPTPSIVIALLFLSNVFAACNAYLANERAKLWEAECVRTNAEWKQVSDRWQKANDRNVATIERYKELLGEMGKK